MGSVANSSTVSLAGKFAFASCTRTTDQFRTVSNRRRTTAVQRASRIHSDPALRYASLGSAVCTLLVPEFHPGSSKTFLIQPVERCSAVVHQPQ
jgi:hypothetical protein